MNLGKVFGLGAFFLFAIPLETLVAVGFVHGLRDCRDQYSRDPAKLAQCESMVNQGISWGGIPCLYLSAGAGALGFLVGKAVESNRSQKPPDRPD